MIEAVWLLVDDLIAGADFVTSARIGFGGPLYNNCNKDPQNSIGNY